MEEEDLKTWKQIISESLDSHWLKSTNTLEANKANCFASATLQRMLMLTQFT